MNPIGLYLSKQLIKLPRLESLPHPDTEFIVVIPCFNEPDLQPCLISIEKAALTATVRIEIIIVINDSDQSSSLAITQNSTTRVWLQSRTNQIPIHTIVCYAIPHQRAGVGYARKTGMDEAVYRFKTIHREHGIICSMDADTTVESNYFFAIKQSKLAKDWECLVIHYEHQPGDIVEERHRQAIWNYELHLRYYIHALRHAGFTPAVQTLGSAIAVDALAYAAVGGMPSRKAGEDFYFIHKFSKRKGVDSLGTTTVSPSSRISDRVPFGTGKTLMDNLNKPSTDFLTYAWQSFMDLRLFLNSIDMLYTALSIESLNLPQGLTAFLRHIEFEQRLQEIKAHTRTLDSFRKRFFHQMDAFIMMKYVHFMRDHYYENEPLIPACIKLLKALDPQFVPLPDTYILLEKFRSLEREK